MPTKLGSSGGAYTFWPKQKQTRPSIQVGTNSIYFISVGVQDQPSNFLSSYTSTEVLDWSVGRNDISGTENILGIAFDSVNELAYVASTGSAGNDTLSLSSVNLADGVVTNIGGMTVTGIDFSPNRVAIGRVDSANGEIHWLGVNDGVSNLYIIQNAATGAQVSTSAIAGGGAGGNTLLTPIYISSDFTKALYFASNDYVIDGNYFLGVVDLTNLRASGFTAIPAGGDGPNIPIPLLAYGSNAVGPNSSNSAASRSDTAKYSDVDLSAALTDFSERLGI